MKAINDRVFCKVAFIGAQGKIVLASETIDNGKLKLNIGKVLSAGDGVTLRTGEVLPVKVKEGDVVIWEQFGAIHFEVLGPSVICVRAEDIGGILDEVDWKGKYMFDDVEIEAYKKKIEDEREEFDRKKKEAQANIKEKAIYRCVDNPACSDRWKEYEKEVGTYSCDCGSILTEKQKVAQLFNGEGFAKG